MASQIVSPRPDATLAGSIQTFRWDVGGIPVERTSLYAGSSPGAANYGRRSVGADTEASLDRLPADGSEVFIRVWYRSAGQWSSLDERYTAASNPGHPTFTSPFEGARLSGSTHRFEWSTGSVPVDRSWVYVGAEVGGSEYGAVLSSERLSAPGSPNAVSVSGLPVGSEQVIHVRLYVLIGGYWYHTDQTFQSALTENKSRDELAKELQRLVGVTPDGQLGPRSRAALDANWLGRAASFDPSFSARFTNDDELIRWVQTRIAAQGGPQVPLTGNFDPTTEAAVTSHLNRGGVVAAESFITLVEP